MRASSLVGVGVAIIRESGYTIYDVIVPVTVGIVGAGPAGLTLALLLHEAGIDCVVLEARSREYVETRVRAGLLEQNTVDLLHRLGVGDRLAHEGLDHTGVYLRFQDRTYHVDMLRLTGRKITIYGQQEVVKDEIAALLHRGVPVHFDVAGVGIHDVDTDRPRITWDGGEVECDYIAGCDGFHGICRRSIPDGLLTLHEYVYAFSWLGVLAEAPPSTDELIYGHHERGFALHSMRSPTISRLYLQVPSDTDLTEWPDERIWDELELRLGEVNRGPLIDRGITPMRSFVADPMRHGRLFLAGDAAHIVPPTGAKGLNLAVNDVRLLAAALASGDEGELNAYSARALRRVWRAQDFSNYMTRLLHDLGDPFEHQLQLARLDYLTRSDVAAASLAENYVGLPSAPNF
jgi:p-hydroxybenzoate 3-monooxygenase